MHFFMQITVSETLLNTGDNRVFVFQIIRADPVKSKVGKRCLRPPAGRNIKVINQFLNRLINMFIIKIINADIGRKISIDRRKSLRAGPFVLQRSHKIDHLTDGCAQMFGGTGFGFAGNTVETFVQQIFQRPAGAIGSQHIQIMNMNVAVAVRFADFGRINMAQPVVGGYLAGNVQNQTAVGIALIGIGINAPVKFFEVFVN